MKIAIIIASLLFYTVYSLQEAEDGSVCANMCSGHGKCVDYTCRCFVGYHGDACDITFAPDAENLIPILNAGHFNLTRKNFTSTINKSPVILVGFSSYNCFSARVAGSFSRSRNIISMGLLILL